MPILFSAVARDKVVLARFASCEGNFIEIASKVLSKVPPKNEKITYFHGPYLFHYIVETNHLYFCITDKSCQRSRAFLFLNQIKRRLLSEGKEGFTQVLADEMYRYNEDYSTIVIQNGELDELNSIGVRSSEEILGEKLLHVKHTEDLNYCTITYLSKTPEEVTVYNNKEAVEDQPIYTFETTNKMTELPESTYQPELCISDNEIIAENDKRSKSRIKIVVAMFLLGLAIYVFDFMPFGQVIVLVLFVIFVLFK